MDPGFAPSGHSDVLHAPELSWVGSAFLPGTESLVQSVLASPLQLPTSFLPTHNAFCLLLTCYLLGPELECEAITVVNT